MTDPTAPIPDQPDGSGVCTPDDGQPDTAPTPKPDGSGVCTPDDAPDAAVTAPTGGR